MQFEPLIFKAYDIRGLVGTELTNDVAYGIGRGLADLLETDGPVAVGYDMRPDSRELASMVRDGLLAQGRDVIEIGQVSTDMIYFAVGHYGMAGGAMVTASHNPGQYNGIKMCRRGAAPIGEETGLMAIRDAMAADSFKSPEREGEVSQRDIMDDWIEHVLSFVDVKQWSAYKIAVDAGNGMAGAVVPHLEGKTPLQITPMYFELDGTFPNHPANPLERENLRDISAKIQEDKLDFGIAFDGDGDRAVLIDADGEPVSGTEMTAIIAEATLVKHPGATILYNVICGRIVPEVIERNGGKGVRTRVGHSFIKADMRTNDAPFGGEHSGHYYFRENFSADSGLIAGLIAVDVLAKSGKSLGELARQYRTYASSGERNFRVEDKETLTNQLAEEYADGEQDRLDGLTVNYPDWWFNVRPSNTEPLLRLNVEAKTQELLEEKLAQLQSILKG